MKKTYTVTCEGLIQRRVLVEAANSAEASMKAREEFCALVGADRMGVAIIDIEKTPTA
jgi:hypothetical protein